MSLPRVPDRTLFCWLLLVAALALHNLEEWVLDLPAWARVSRPLPWMAGAFAEGRFGASLVAVTVLPVVVAVIVRWRAPHTQPAWLALFAVILMLNAASHIGLSLVTWSRMPGLLTAVALLLPASWWVLRHVRRASRTGGLQS